MLKTPVDDALLLVRSNMVDLNDCDRQYTSGCILSIATTSRLPELGRRMAYRKHLVWWVEMDGHACGHMPELCRVWHRGSNGLMGREGVQAAAVDM